MIKKLSLYIFLFIVLLQGQERPVPLTRINLPSDSIATKQESQKITPSSDQIELPDVVVYGKDHSNRAGENKIASTADVPRLIVPQYLPLSMWQRRDNTRYTLRETPQIRNSWFYGNLSGGSYTTIRGGLTYGQKISSGSFDVSGWLDQSQGAYVNSEYLEGGLQGKMHYLLRPHLSGTAKIDYSGMQRGLHGTAWQQAKRTAHSAALTVSAVQQLDADTEANFDGSFDTISLHSDSSSKQMQKSSDFTLHLRGAYSRKWQETHLLANASYLYESFDQDPRQSVASASFGEINAKAFTPITTKMVLSFAIGVQSYISDSSRATRFAPSATLRYLPSTLFGISIHMGSGLMHQNYHHFAEMNPYIAHSFPLRVEENKFALKLECEAVPVPYLTLGMTVNRSWMRTLFYWQREADGLIKLESLRNPELTELRIHANVAPTKRMKIKAMAIVLTDKISIADSLTHSDGIPYRPKYHFEMGADYELLQDFFLTGGFTLVGERIAAIDGKGHLPPYGLLNVSATKKIDRHFNIFLSLINILASKYEIWQGYREPRFQVITGANIRF